MYQGFWDTLPGDKVVTAGAGTWVFKPRGHWHTFWNAGEAPGELIEVISSGGFEDYFRDVATAWGDRARFAQINQRDQLKMDFESVPLLCQRFGVVFPQICRRRASLLLTAG